MIELNGFLMCDIPFDGFKTLGARNKCLTRKKVRPKEKAINFYLRVVLFELIFDIIFRRSDQKDAFPRKLS